MKYNSELDVNEKNSLSILIDRIKPHSTVLEFGSANGRMTKYLSEELHCSVYAVEIDSEAAKDAAKFAKKIVVDSIENYGWQKEFENIKFDTIIFADVLEHLYDPQKVLMECKPFLKEEGSILVSVPNIAHNAIIINLLKNEFNYNALGLLDNTHIKFFTKKTFDQLIEKTGYFKTYETATFVSPEESEFENSYSDLPQDVAEYLKGLDFGEMYQLIYELKKHPTPITSDYELYPKDFIQLFIEEDDGISETNSLKFPVDKNSEFQEFVFDLADKKAVKGLRLDPFNNSCIIEIKKISLIKEDESEIDLIEHLAANSCYQHEKNYFFNTSDPQIYIANIEPNLYGNAGKLLITLRYIHTQRDALEHTITEMEHKIDELKKQVDSMKIKSRIKRLLSIFR